MAGLSCTRRSMADTRLSFLLPGSTSGLMDVSAAMKVADRLLFYRWVTGSLCIGPVAGKIQHILYQQVWDIAKRSRLDLKNYKVLNRSSVSFDQAALRSWHTRSQYNPRRRRHAIFEPPAFPPGLPCVFCLITP